MGATVQWEASWEDPVSLEALPTPLLLSLTTQAPPTVSALTGLALLSSPLALLPLSPTVSLAMALLEELAMELSPTELSAMELLPTVLSAMVSATDLLEELPTELVLPLSSTDTLATTELPSSTLPSLVESDSLQMDKKYHNSHTTFKIGFKCDIYFMY